MRREIGVGDRLSDMPTGVHDGDGEFVRSEPLDEPSDDHAERAGFAAAGVAEHEEVLVGAGELPERGFHGVLPEAERDGVRLVDGLGELVRVEVLREQSDGRRGWAGPGSGDAVPQRLDGVSEFASVCGLQDREGDLPYESVVAEGAAGSRSADGIT